MRGNPLYKSMVPSPVGSIPAHAGEPCKGGRAGSIPAHAGEPGCILINSQWIKVYPRACGGTPTKVLL